MYTNYHYISDRFPNKRFKNKSCVVLSFVIGQNTSCQLVTSSKNLVTRAQFLVALAISSPVTCTKSKWNFWRGLGLKPPKTSLNGIWTLSGKHSIQQLTTKVPTLHYDVLQVSTYRRCVWRGLQTKVAVTFLPSSDVLER